MMKLYFHLENKLMLA